MSETDLEAEAEEHARLTADLPPLDENEISDEQLLREIDVINEEVNSAQPQIQQEVFKRFIPLVMEKL